MGDPERPLRLTFTPTVQRFLMSPAFLRILMGPRGEGKSIGAFAALIKLAQETPAEARPVRVACIRDTWTNLQRTSMETVRELARLGIAVRWMERDTEAIVGRGLLHLIFMGMETEKDINRLQGFSSGALLIEEPAPAAGISGGVSADVLAVGVTSLRQPGVAHKAIITMNPPDDEHWTMKLKLDADRVLFTIPPGERVPDEIRQRNREALEEAGRGDLVTRLVEGKVGLVIQGEPVTPEYRDELHLAERPLPILKSVDVIRLWDFGLCVDEQTEILTEKGWKKFPDLSSDELVATRSSSGRLEFQTISRRIARWYVGPMLAYRNQNLDMMVTPEHDIPVLQERGRAARAVYRKLSADTLSHYRNPHAAVPLTAQWAPTPQPISCGPVKWPPDVFASFMGWWLAEGCVMGKRPLGPTGVTIYQTKRHPGLLAVLQSTGLIWRELSDRGHLTGWTTNHAPLASYLAQSGRTAHVKRVHPDIKALGESSIRHFLDAFIAGDGHTRTRPNGSSERVAFTVSEGLAGDLQDLALRAGWYARVTWRGPTERLLTDYRGSHIVKSSGGYSITFKMKATRSYLLGKTWRIEPYDGMVYCATVPNGTIYVRRNGIPYWTGNSPTCIWTQVSPLGAWHVLGCVRGENIGLEQLIETHVRPWQKRFLVDATAFRFRDIGDPAGTQREQSNSERSAVRTLVDLLQASFEPGAVEWATRRDRMKAVLQYTIRGRGRLQIDPDPSSGALMVRAALRGGAHYKKDGLGRVVDTVESFKRASGVHSHPFDSLCYGAAALFPDPAEFLVPRRPARPERRPLAVGPAEKAWMLA